MFKFNCSYNELIASTKLSVSAVHSVTMLSSKVEVTNQGNLRFFKQVSYSAYHCDCMGVTTSKSIKLQQINFVSQY